MILRKHEWVSNEQSTDSLCSPEATSQKNVADQIVL